MWRGFADVMADVGLAVLLSLPAGRAALPAVLAVSADAGAAAFTAAPAPHAVRGDVVAAGEPGLGPRPARRGDVPAEDARGGLPAPARQDTACRPAPLRYNWDVPVYTPYTEPPVLANRAEVRAALVREYPPELKHAGAGGTTVVWIHIDECGSTTGARVRTSGGSIALDDAAIRVAAVMRWKPGRYDDRPVSVWATIPIVFRTSGEPAFSATDTTAAAPGTDREWCAAFVRPVGACEGVLARRIAPPGYRPIPLQNRGEIDALLHSRYPDSLRAARVAGTTVVRIAIDPDGRVTSARIARGSGRDDLDHAALAVARAMRFYPPADTLGRLRSATVQVPIRFERE